MSQAHALTPRRISRLSSNLWGLALVLIVALAFGIGVVYLPGGILQARETGAAIWGLQEYYLTIFLVGLAVLFCCHAALKRRQLNALNRRLLSEEHELAETKTRLSEILSLFKLTTTLNIHLPSESILNILVQRVVNAMKAQQASVMLYDAATGILETRAAYGVESEFALNARCRLGEQIAGTVASERRAIILDGSHDELGKYFKEGRNITSALVIPLYHESRCIGVMNVNRINHPQPFKEYHCELGEIFGNHVAKAIAGSEMVNLLDTCATQLESDLASVTWRLGDLDRMKDVFLSTASHELRTPLTALIGNLAMLETHGDSEHRDRLLGEARAACGHLSKLVGDIVNVARVESGDFSLNRDPVDFNELVRGVLAAVAPSAVQNAVRFEEDYEVDLPEVYLDPDVTRGVLIQLLDAAVRFSPEGGEIRVRTAHRHGFLALEIRDQGHAIPEGHASGIFSLFGHNLRESEQSLSGLGLGLYMVKRIVELHGGRVTAGPGEGGGIVYALHFPVRSPADRAA